LPELPEVEAISRRLNEATLGATVGPVLVTGVSTLKSFDPPITSIRGLTVTGVGRKGKYLTVSFGEDLALLIHLMSAGRLQLFDKRGSVKDRTSRLLIGLEDGRELRLREFGTRQSAWAKLGEKKTLLSSEPISTLGPEAWPDPPPLVELLKQPRPLHVLLRDQRVISGIGRSWVDEILHAARLAPFKRGNILTSAESEALRDAMVDKLGGAIDYYEESVGIPLPDKFPMPLQVHGKAGEPCPRCGGKIEAVHYEDHVMAYCPACQTGGKILKDRRLSRLLK
jgi:formamidopyrimidine-DNA glycosylase